MKYNAKSYIISNKLSKLNNLDTKELSHDNIISFSNPPATREWNNSIYAYNNSYVKNIPAINNNLNKLIKSFLSIYLKNKSLKRKRVWLSNKKRSGEQIFVSKAAIKHTNDKIIIITYFYDESKKRSLHKIRKLVKANKEWIFRVNNIIKNKSKSEYSLLRVESPGVACPTCAVKGQEIDVKPGKACNKCGTILCPTCAEKGHLISLKPYIKMKRINNKKRKIINYSCWLCDSHILNKEPIHIYTVFNLLRKKAYYFDQLFIKIAKNLVSNFIFFKINNQIIDLLRDEINSITDQLNYIEKISAEIDKWEITKDHNQYNVELDPRISVSFLINSIFKDKAIFYRLMRRLGKENLFGLIYRIKYLKSQYDSVYNNIAPWLKDKEYSMKLVFGKSFIYHLNSLIYKIYIKRTQRLKKSEYFFYLIIISLYVEDKFYNFFSLNSINRIINLEYYDLFKRSFIENIKIIASDKKKSHDLFERGFDHILSKFTKNSLNPLIGHEPALDILSNLVKNSYKKKVEFRFINLKYPYLNSDILLQIIGLKLRERKNRILRVFKLALSRVRLPNINRTIEKYGKLEDIKPKSIKPFNINKDIIDQLILDSFFLFKPGINMKKDISIETVVNSLKYKFIGGVRLEGKGRLTKRFTASRSIFKVKWKGGLKNIDSSYKGLSSVILKGHLKSNVQYSTIKSKTRIGAFGLKGWISGK